jgi:hypothetical protein
LGNWQLRFTAPKKPALKAGQPTSGGFYVPGLAVASISFSRGDDDQLTIQNQLQVGPTRLRFTGPAKVLPKKKSAGLRLCASSDNGGQPDRYRSIAAE